MGSEADIKWAIGYLEEDAEVCSAVNGERDQATKDARRLEVTVKRLARERTEATAQIATLEERLRVAEGALRPFADRANRYRNSDLAVVHDNVELWQLEGNAGMRVDLTVGDLRFAARALATTSTGGDPRARFGTGQPDGFDEHDNPDEDASDG